MSGAYELAPVFLIRMAGAPFEVLNRLATLDAISLGRQAAAPTPALTAVLERELTVARTALIESAATVLPRLLIFGSGAVRELLAYLERVSGRAPLPHRNARTGDRERHLLLYLQRICAKNDTFSEFGPSGWGKIEHDISGVRFAPLPGIARREAFFERWTAHAVAAAINADADAPATMAVPALEPHPFVVLHRDVQGWPDGACKKKWLSILRAMADLPERFAADADTKERQAILDRAGAELRSIGAERHAGERFLYAATNPIGEECFRECNFSISDELTSRVAIEAEPWIDFWRDSYAFVAARVATGLRHVLENAGAKTGVMPLPDFLRACEAAKLPLAGQGLVALAVVAFQEVKAAFRERLRPHIGLVEYELTPEDCHIVRNSFDYPKFNEYTYPSADLQLAAASVKAVECGDCRWILAELHPPPALLHHCMYWACPDKAALNAALARTVCGKPGFHFGFFAADFTSHTTVRMFDALPQYSNFVAPQRCNAQWRCLAPAATEVYVNAANGDVCLRKIDDHEHLGSFARAWVIPLGFHPFQFGLAPHTPRLRCGNVVVQRQTWTATLEEFPRGNFNGVSRDLLVAVERLRVEKNLPRHIYIRPTEQALRRSGVEGRDKDTKPIYIDLESYLFLELFYRWLRKAGEIEITEMLPAPDELLWREEDGRRTFELRTLIVPRS